MIGEGRIFFWWIQQKYTKAQESRKIIASSLDFDIIAVEFEVEIHNLRDRVIELKMNQLEDAKYKQIVHNYINKEVINEHPDEFINFKLNFLFRMKDCSNFSLYNLGWFIIL